MQILGIDFTSRPRRAKPITALQCTLQGDHLEAGTLHRLESFEAFEALLDRPGPWVAGLDFPFGQARRFIRNIGWPEQWADYVGLAQGLGRAGFRSALDDYRSGRPAGDREHRRQSDALAGAISPQKLYGVPVGLMFFEGAPRLLASGVTVAGLQRGDPGRIAVEAYPGLLARHCIGRRSYKQDTRSKQTAAQAQARRDLLHAVRGAAVRDRYGLRVSAPDTLADDPGADTLDALLCAIQAAWAWRQGPPQFGLPASTDTLEGWIADPGLAQPGQG